MNVLVIVTSKKSAREAIEMGSKYIKKEEDNFYVVHLANYEAYFSGRTEEGDDLDYIYNYTLEFGGNLQIIRSNRVLETILELVEEKSIDKLIFGDMENLYISSNFKETITSEMKDKLELIFI